MVAAKKDLYIEQGATFILSFAWYDGTPETPGNPIDLTGAVARMQIRKSQQTAILFEATSEGATPNIVLGGATGTITVTITDEDTDNIGVQASKYDLEVVHSDGRTYRLLQGAVTLNPNITQTIDDPVAT